VVATAAAERSTVPAPVVTKTIVRYREVRVTPSATAAAAVPVVPVVPDRLTALSPQVRAASAPGRPAQPTYPGIPDAFPGRARDHEGFVHL
jgi:hypothetical protein